MAKMLLWEITLSCRSGERLLATFMISVVLTQHTNRMSGQGGGKLQDIVKVWMLL
jgi:hypothetical protein